MSLEVDRSAFRRDGYAVVRGVFASREVARFRELLAAVHDRAQRAGDFDRMQGYPHLVLLRGDLLGIDELRPVDYIVLDARVVECVRQLLGPRIVYHGDCSAQVGEGLRGFHKDCADRGIASGVDWQGEYGVIRLAVYLQDHTAHSGGLKVRWRSHNHVSHHRGRARNVDTNAGDLVFWYLTTSHSGNVVRVRGVPRLCLHPRLERIVPAAMRVAESAQRLSVFCCFGAAGKHLDHYIDYQSRRPDVRLHWRYCGSGAAIDALAAERGVELRRAIPEYASVYLERKRAAATPQVSEFARSA